MMNLKALTAAGVAERKVKPSEDVRVGGQRFTAGDLLSVRLDRGYDDEPVSVLVMFKDETGRYMTLERGSVLAVGSESWAVAELVEFELVAPQEAPEVVPPYCEGTYRVHFRDGTTMHLDAVARFEDLSPYEWHEGVAIPPRELAEVAP